MCKVVAFTNTAKLSKKAPGIIGGIINKLERDGYGYAVSGANGVFGEKSVFSAFKSRLLAKNVVTLPIVKRQHETFGVSGAFAGPGIFHGRTSTNDKGILNCHPMRRDGWNLIHNGVVTDSGPAYEKITTNDSEDVLARLILGIDHVEANLSGYYAFAAIDPEGRLHVARDSQATLFCALSPDLDSYVFATTESLLKSLARELKFKHGPIEAVEDNVYFIFSGSEMIHSQYIKPLGYTKRESAYASLSLGREIEATGSTGGVVDATEGWPDTGEPDSRREARRVARRSRDLVERDARLEKLDTDAEFLYQLEIDNMDRSYTVVDRFGTEISVEDFKRMQGWEQELCNVTRPDGTIMGEDEIDADDLEAYHG